MLLDPEVANLNTGSFGPWSRPVFERVTQLRQRLAEEPMDFFLRLAPGLLWQAREEFGRFLGASPRRLVFSANVTAAMNIVAAGLTLAAPGEILLTDHEYLAMQWCWERAAQRQGLTLRTFPVPVRAEDPGEIVAAFRAAMTPRTRLLFFSHVLSPTGLVLPAQEMCREARRHGILTVVDGAHAPAMIDLELDALGCDFYGGNGHKWLLAPTGSGFLYIGAGNEDRLSPLQVSWGWHARPDCLDEPDEFGTTPRIRRLEFEGTRDPCPWLAVPTAIAFQERLGRQNIRARNAELAACVRSRIGAELGLQPVTPANPRLSGFLTAFRLPAGIDPLALRCELWDKSRIEIPVVERPDGYLLRVSTHFYNTREEIDRLATALRLAGGVVVRQ
ncbi:MAG: aminotransferase class V-fold PLP-dependent enzyme [Planctomycetes bacterium]|nr:aminotransferase class V-fold PLP-dependent enzyme [Planctomycetota bacterium]